MTLGILLPDLRSGGAERVAVNLANAFIQKNYAVDLILLSAKGELLSDLHPKICVVDLQVKRLRDVLFPLMRYLRQTQPKALLACMWPLTVIALWARGLARVKTRVVVAEHTTWSLAELTRSRCVRWLVRTTMHHTFPKADAIVTVSLGVADDLATFASIDRKTITAIYNPVVEKMNIEATDEFEPSDWWTGPHQKILAVGTLKAVKDYATLLKAFAQLRQFSNAKLLILGEGDCRTALESQIQQLNIDGNVFMPGFVKDPAPFFQRADLHVLSSRNEGLGNVLIEAFAAGTPVVSTDCPYGPREILEDGRYGKLVEVGDAESLAAAMLATLNEMSNPERLKTRSRKFSIEKAVKKYLKLLYPESATGSDSKIERD